MPWNTPSLTSVRQRNRDYVAARLSLPLIPNGDVRVLADANAGNAHLNLQYLDWLSTQLLPDTAEKQFLDKWANIYLVNADGTRGRKSATYAAGTGTFTATVAGTVLPQFAQVLAGGVLLQTTAAVTLDTVPTPVPLRALDAGAAGNLPAGTGLSLVAGIAGVSGTGGAVNAMAGGADEEDDDDLRVRLLDRIRKPPMGGDADDYEAWALEVAGVTRAWCSPLEMGMGTVTVRVMCDDLRASNFGLPADGDLDAVRSYLDTVRPVAVKDFFVVAPILQPVNFAITDLAGDSIARRAKIASGVAAMLKTRAAPARALNGVRQPAVDIPAAWVDAAVYAAVGGVAYDLGMVDAIMANAGCMATLGTIGS